MPYNPKWHGRNPKCASLRMKKIIISGYPNTLTAKISTLRRSVMEIIMMLIDSTSADNDAI